MKQVVGVILISINLLLIGCTPAVSYYVDSSTGMALVTYSDGGSIISDEVATPWEKEVSADSIGMYQIIASSDIYYSGTVSCKIDADGAVRQQSGVYVHLTYTE